MQLLKTAEDVYFYLREKREDITYMAQQADDLKNAEGARLMREAAQAINACMAQIDI